MMYILLLTIISCISTIWYSYYSGYIDARLFFYKFRTAVYIATGIPEKDEDEHVPFTKQRFVYFLHVSGAHLLFFNWWQSIIIGVAHAMLYPFIHEGSMAKKRESMLPGTYPAGFWSDSKTSDAESDKKKWSPIRTLEGRITCFGIGLIVISSLIISKL